MNPFRFYIVFTFSTPQTPLCSFVVFLGQISVTLYNSHYKHNLLMVFMVKRPCINDNDL